MTRKIKPINKNTVLIILLLVIVSMTVYISFNQQVKFSNFENGFKQFMDSNFRIQNSMMQETCDIKHRLNMMDESVTLIESLNMKQKCDMRVIIAEKLYDSATKGIQPNFTNNELEYMKEVVKP